MKRYTPEEVHKIVEKLRLTRAKIEECQFSITALTDGLNAALKMAKDLDTIAVSFQHSASGGQRIHINVKATEVITQIKALRANTERELKSLLKDL